MSVSGLVQMKAKSIGTVVGPHINNYGDPIGDQMIHVDPDNDLENGRYSRPIVTETVAALLEKNGFAERVTGKGETVTRKSVRELMEGPAEERADLSGERLQEDGFEEADNAFPQASNLSTRNLTNYPNGEQIRGGAGPAPGSATFPPTDGGEGEGGEGEGEGEDDAPAAPAPKPARGQAPKK